MQDRPLISIIMTTYGHEKYIKYALDSILMQKTDFSYEVLIGEDCSPDNTRAILKEYEEKYPGVFTIFYREKNMGTRDNSQDLVQRAKGKYLASLEGDDYWISGNRLQKLASFLEENPDYIGAANKALVVDENNNPREGIKYPDCRKKEYTLKEYRRGFLPGQSAATMIRNVYPDRQFDISIKQRIPKGFPPDRITAFLWAANGKYRCFDDVMTAYRYVTTNGTSYSATVQKNKHAHYGLFTSCYKMVLNEIEDNYSKEAVATINSLYLYTLLCAALKSDEFKFKDYFKAFISAKYKCRSTVYLIQNIFRRLYRRIMRKKTGYIGW